MIKTIKDKYKVVLEINTGSHLYGTNTPTSDIDICGIVMPSIEEVFGFEKMEEIDLSIKDKDVSGRNTSEAIDIKYYEFRKFIKLALECNPNILEMMFVNKENINYIDEIGKSILDNSHLFPNKDLIKMKYLSYSKSQKHKMTLKVQNSNDLFITRDYLLDYIGSDSLKDLTDKESILKSKQLLVELKKDIIDKNIPIKFYDSFIKIGDINLNNNLNVKHVVKDISGRLETSSSRKELWDKYGYDTKFCMNVFRLLFEAQELLGTNRIEFPLKRREFLLDVKSGKYKIEEVMSMVEIEEKELEHSYTNSRISNTIRYKEIQDFVIKTNKTFFN